MFPWAECQSSSSSLSHLNRAWGLKKSLRYVLTFVNLSFPFLFRVCLTSLLWDAEGPAPPFCIVCDWSAVFTWFPFISCLSIHSIHCRSISDSCSFSVSSTLTPSSHFSVTSMVYLRTGLFETFISSAFFISWMVPLSTPDEFCWFSCCSHWAGCELVSETLASSLLSLFLLPPTLETSKESLTPSLNSCFAGFLIKTMLLVFEGPSEFFFSGPSSFASSSSSFVVSLYSSSIFLSHLEIIQSWSILLEYCNISCLNSAIDPLSSSRSASIPSMTSAIRRFFACSSAVCFFTWFFTDLLIHMMQNFLCLASRCLLLTSHQDKSD